MNKSEKETENKDDAPHPKARHVSSYFLAKVHDDVPEVSDGGLGAALATTFHERGYRVFATSRNLKTMSQVSGLPGVQIIQLDVKSATDIQAAKTAVSEETGGSLSYLINCAARNHFMPLLDENIEDAKLIHETNIWGPLAVTQAFAPLLIKAKGSLVFITSIAGHLNTPYQGTYAASKMSEEIIAETLRLELAPFGVKVLSIESGALRTMGQTYFDDWKLPAHSLYEPLGHVIRNRARGQEGAPRMERQEYAKRVVSEITAGRAGKFWYGASAGVVKFAVSYLPTWLMDRAVQMNTGLDWLTKAHHSEIPVGIDWGLSR